MIILFLLGGGWNWMAFSMSKCHGPKHDLHIKQTQFPIRLSFFPLDLFHTFFLFISPDIMKIIKNIQTWLHQSKTVIWVSETWGFPGSRAQAQELCHRLSYSTTCGIRDGTCVSCVGRQVLYHGATREALDAIARIFPLYVATFP